jgi:uncharacterized protein (DUF433 family)
MTDDLRAAECRETQRYTADVTDIAERIAVDPEQCGGRSCVREPKDLHACLRFAARYLDHPVLVA